MTVLTADPAAFEEALAVLKAASMTDRYVRVADCLRAVLDVVARHGLDETGQASLRRGLAWIAAVDEAAQQDSRWAYDRTAVAEAVRKSRFGPEFDVLPEDIGGYDPCTTKGNSHG